MVRPDIHDPTFGIPVAAIHIRDGDCPTSPFAQARSLRPDECLKLRNPPFFKGESAQANPCAVRQWLRCMDRHVEAIQPSPIGCSYLKEMQLPCKMLKASPRIECRISTLEVVFWEAFIKSLLHRFVSEVSCVQALADLKQLASQSVQEYAHVDFRFRQRREELKVHLISPFQISLLNMNNMAIDSMG